MIQYLSDVNCNKRAKRKIKKGEGFWVHCILQEQIKQAFIKLTDTIMNLTQHHNINTNQSQKDLIEWLEKYSKSKEIPKNNNIQSQLQSITESYRNAQEKLLSLERQLSLESIYNEKQRSIIQILKYILNQNMDDTTILTYIYGLEEELGADEKKYEIRDQLQQIKMMVDKRKSVKKKGQSLKDGAISELKKQVKKLNEVKKQLIEDIDSIVNEKYGVETKLQELGHKNEELEKQIKQLKQKESKYREREQQKIKLKEQGQRLCSEITDLKAKNMEVQKSLQKILQTEETQAIDRMVKKLQNKLNKYRKSCKQLSQKLVNNCKQSQLKEVMKLFMSEEGSKIVEEYERTNQDCLLRELQNVYRLQKNRQIQLQNCQQEMWKCKVKLLREDETWASSKRKSSFGKENILNSRNVSQFKMQ